jgi:hypothetical protein
MTRRRVLSAGLVAVVLAAALPAFGGTYLSRAALLVAGGARELNYLRARFADKELARVVQRMAQARLDTAAAMTVPKEVTNAHPHLLLIFENHVQAAEAATRGEGEKFNVFFQKALDEERTFRAVLKNNGWTLPDAP